MYGFAGLTAGELLDSAGTLIAVGVNHLSAYSLETSGVCTVLPAREEDEEEQGDSLTDFLEASGLLRYEVSNYARPGFESRHNTGYWEGWSYMGLGPGAHGFIREAASHGERYANAPDLTRWSAALTEGRLPPGGTERPNDSEAALEKLFLALRRSAPFEAAKISKDPRLLPGLRALVGTGDLESAGEGFFNSTKQALKRADGLAIHLHSLLFPE
jgi:oxygen-independent coproporphyrinogen-3 oxidase